MQATRPPEPGRARPRADDHGKPAIRRLLAANASNGHGDFFGGTAKDNHPRQMSLPPVPPLAV